MNYYPAIEAHLEEKQARQPAYRAAVIGCGRSGSLFDRDKLRTHPASLAGLFHYHKDTALVAGCDLLEERLRDFAEDWKIDRRHTYDNYLELLDREKPDIVAIATYTESHSDIVIAAAEAGTKIILCEKPIALDLQEADRMIAICKARGATLAVHHERRWVHIYRSARLLIERGEIGEVRTIIGNVLTGAPKPDWHANPAISGGGPTLHDGTHLFDAISYLCGRIVEVNGETEHHNPKLGVEDTGRATLRLENGAVAFVECGGRRRYFNFEIDIQGTKGRLVIGNAVQNLFTVAPSTRYEGFAEFEQRGFPRLVPDEYFPYIVDEIIEAHEAGRASISSGHDGRSALANVLSVYGDRAIARSRIRVVNG